MPRPPKLAASLILDASRKQFLFDLGQKAMLRPAVQNFSAEQLSPVTPSPLPDLAPVQDRG